MTEAEKDVGIHPLQITLEIGRVLTNAFLSLILVSLCCMVL